MSDAAQFQANRLLYTLLAVGGGIFGAHNFYAGRKRIALFQLLLTVLSCGLLSGITLITVLADIFCFDPAAKKFTKKWFFAAAGIFILLLALAAGGLYALHRHNLESECYRNCVSIQNALLDYALTHDGKFPAGDNDTGLLELNLSPEQLFCPVEEDRRYVYLGGADWTKIQNYPILFELPGGHFADRILVFYSHGASRYHKIPGCKTVYDVLVFLEKQATSATTKDFLHNKQKLYSPEKN